MLVRMWWRILIPTWRFFDSAGPGVELWVCENGEWRKFLRPPPRRWFQLFYNPQWTLFHAHQNLVERMAVEAGEGMPPHKTDSFALIDRLVGGLPFKIKVRGEDILVKQ